MSHEDKKPGDLQLQSNDQIGKEDLRKIYEACQHIRASGVHPFAVCNAIFSIMQVDDEELIEICVSSFCNLTARLPDDECREIISDLRHNINICWDENGIPRPQIREAHSRLIAADVIAEANRG